MAQVYVYKVGSDPGQNVKNNDFVKNGLHESCGPNAALSLAIRTIEVVIFTVAHVKIETVLAKFTADYIFYNRISQSSFLCVANIIYGLTPLEIADKIIQFITIYMIDKHV